jgi:hypothetical protein
VFARIKGFGLIQHRAVTNEGRVSSLIGPKTSKFLASQSIDFARSVFRYLSCP